MVNQFSRTELLFGEEAMQKLYKSKVIVFGVGGVGGYVVEALARSGVGEIHICDNDTVSLTNINRQILATHKTLGELKVDVCEERIHDINPNCIVKKFNLFYLPETEEMFDFSYYHYIVDAIDTVSGKIALAVNAKKAKTPIISCMGAGNKINPQMFEVADIYNTSVCPLAKVMRRELKKRGIDCLKVVYSKEDALKPIGETEEESQKRQIPGSTAFTPSVAGLILAGEVIKDLIK